MGAWIEIITSSFGILRAHGSLPSWERGLKCYDRHQYPPLSWSLPSWERGLKFEIDKICIRIELVAPLVGAWIEIIAKLYKYVPIFVAPLVGAWIEICNGTPGYPYVKSLPSWERGLKSVSKCLQRSKACRSPRGSVD